MLPDDLIVAVSSPPGRSARGLLRITGAGLADFLPHLLSPAPHPHHLTATCLLLPPLPLGEGRGEGCLSPAPPQPPTPNPQPLSCLSLFSPAPRSFTSQDTLELQLPGSPALLDRVLHHVLTLLRKHTNSGRLAEPGEFTHRAFLAGRIDLTRAEGIAATIGAISDAQLQAARLLRTGRLGRWAVDLVDRLGQLLALVEAGIDFVDQDDVVPISPRQLHAGLAVIRDELAAMLARSRSWSALEALPWVVLVGPPNAGKSTLFNTLLGHPRAVVSDVAGTTRDVLAEPLRIGDGEAMLVDIAGLDDARSALDSQVQSAARAAIDRAELVLLLTPADDASPVTPPRTDVPVLHLRTKCDASPKPDRESANGRGSLLCVSAHTGRGLPELRDSIAAALRGRAVTLAGQVMALQPRHRGELEAALAAADEAAVLLAGQLDRRALGNMELIADRLRESLDRLGALGGQLTSDDVIGKVFATFCVGK
jgi:tRNA modification GTPase